MPRRLVAAGVLAASLLTAPQAAGQTAPGELVPVPREGAAFAVPLYGTLLRPYDAPDNPYAPGHRGVDIGADRGTPVRAPAPGLVTFAGTVVDNRSVTVDHGGGLQTTCSYLATIAVKKGQAVVQGQVLGAVGDGHPGSGLPPHVHLAARRDGVYFDPITLYIGVSYADLLSITG